MTSGRDADSAPNPSEGPAGAGWMAFRAEPASVAAARSYVVDQAGLGPPLDADVALATSELATNAVVHARTPFAVRVRRGPRALRVEVADASETLPRLSAGAEGRGGRGLRIVEAVTRRWGAERDGPGKVVWFEVDLAGAGEG